MSHIAPVKAYVTVFGTLMVLTSITVAAAFTNLGSFNFPVALAIAITKATVVILFFMHVKYSPKLTWAVVAGSVFWLGIMLALTITDYATRSWRTYG